MGEYLSVDGVHVVVDDAPAVLEAAVVLLAGLDFELGDDDFLGLGPRFLRPGDGLVQQQVAVALYPGAAHNRQNPQSRLPATGRR